MKKNHDIITLPNLDNYDIVVKEIELIKKKDDPALGGKTEYSIKLDDNGGGYFPSIEDLFDATPKSCISFDWEDMDDIVDAVRWLGDMLKMSQSK